MDQKDVEPGEEGVMDEEAQAAYKEAERLKLEEEEREAEWLREISVKNKARVLFTKPTVKYIVSHHSGTLLAKDEPISNFKLEEEPVLQQRVLEVYSQAASPAADEGAGADPDDVVLVSKDMLPSLLAAAGFQCEEGFLWKVIDKFFAAHEELAQEESVSEDTFCRIVESVKAPAFQFGQHFRRYAGRGQLQQFTELLGRQINPNCMDGEGLTALHYACNFNRPQIIEALFSMAPDEIVVDMGDKYGWTPLYCAVHHNSQDCVQLLLRAGANPLACNKVGKNCLHSAANRGRTALVEMLLEHMAALPEEGGPPVEEGEGGEGGSKPPSRPSSRPGGRQGPGVADLINSQDNRGMTPLHDAAYRGQLKTYSLLVKLPETDTEVRDDLGRQPSEYLEDPGQ